MGLIKPSSGGSLPTLANEVDAGKIYGGHEVINQNGEIVKGTMNPLQNLSSSNVLAKGSDGFYTMKATRTTGDGLMWCSVGQSVTITGISLETIREKCVLNIASYVNDTVDIFETEGNHKLAANASIEIEVPCPSIVSIETPTACSNVEVSGNVENVAGYASYGDEKIISFRVTGDGAIEVN